MRELQADCFAGAWTGDVEAGNSEFFELVARRPRQGRRRLPRAARRRRHRPPADPAAHGTGFDRIGAFVEGYEQGAERCAEYPDALDVGRARRSSRCPSPTRPTSSAAATSRSTSSGRSLLADLENFWTLLFEAQGRDVDAGHRRGHLSTPPSTRSSAATTPTAATCSSDASFYCVDERHHLPRRRQPPPRAQRDRRLRGRHRDRPPVRVRRPGCASVTSRTPSATNLQADCLAGVYASQRLRRRPGGPGPGALPVAGRPRRGRDRVPAQQRRQRRRSSDGDESVGTAFQRFDAYRDGFLEGAGGLRRASRLGPRRSRPGSTRLAHDQQHGTADRDHHQGRAARAAAPRPGHRPPAGPTPSWAAARCPGWAPATVVRRRRAGPGPPPERSARAAQTSVTEHGEESTQRHRVRRRRRLGGSGGPTWSASSVRVASRSHSHRPPSLRSRPERHVGDGAIGERDHLVALGAGLARRPGPGSRRCRRGRRPVRTRWPRR